MLILAAVAGLVMGLDGMRRRREYCLRRARAHRIRFIMLECPHCIAPVGRKTYYENRRPLEYLRPRSHSGPDPSWVWNSFPPEAVRIADEDRVARIDPQFAWHLDWARRFERVGRWEAAPMDPLEAGGPAWR
jgi:hypothetical protein